MLAPEDIVIELIEAEGSLALVTVATPVGVGKMLGSLRFVGKTLYIDGVHIDGAMRGRLGRAGVNAVLRKLMVEANVERLVIQGEVRTTGRYAGRRPSPFVFPHGA